MTTTSGPDGSVGAPAIAAAPVGRSRLVGVLLAAVIPGAGHLYARHWLAGLLWMAVSLAVYATSLWGGLVVHGLCVVSTALTRPR